MKTIGPMFGEDLRAAGLASRVNSFVVGGTEKDIYAPKLTDAERDTLAAVVAAHDPLRPAIGPTPDEIYDLFLRNDRILRAVVLAINDGSLTVGGNRTPAQLRAIIKAKL